MPLPLAFTALLLAAGRVLGAGAPAGTAQEPTHGTPEGAAYHASGIASLVGRDRVRLSLACPAGSVPCRGTVSLTTLPLRRAARYHVLRHRETLTRIAIRSEVDAPPPFLSDRVVVRAAT